MNEELRQLLRDANITPTEDLIAECPGSSSIAYKAFLEGLQDQHITLMECRYYNDGKAWLSKWEYKWTTSRRTDKVKSIFWISIWEGFFKISFHFSEKYKDKLLALAISDRTKKKINDIVPTGAKMKYLPLIFRCGY